MSSAKKQTEFQTNLGRGNLFFWTEFVPFWIPLLELYEATGDKRYLEAAHQGAREFAQFIYGDQPGEIYGEKDVWLWMPKELLKIDNEQVNYLAARRDRTLYIVLMNQSPEAITAKVELNKSLVDFGGDQPLAVRIWEENQRRDSRQMKNGIMDVSLAGKGITVLAVEGVRKGRLGGVVSMWIRQRPKM